MNDESSVQENVQELEREARRLQRLRLVVDLPRPAGTDDDCFEPDPKEAA